MKQITMVRVYLTESEGKLNNLLDYLHGKVRGVTVLRGISGFGQSGKLHSAHLVDLSLDLPVIIEFFDTPEKVTQILSELKNLVEPNHIVYWSASVIDNH